MTWREELAQARGVRAWPYGVAPRELEEAATELGMRYVHLDGGEVEDKAAFLALCEEAFALPEWFGRNWDALEEALADLPVGEGTVVLWSGWELLEDVAPQTYATAVDVFASTARLHATDGARFVVLLDEGLSED